MARILPRRPAATPLALVLLPLVLAVASPGAAQQAPPSPADVLGYGLGERFTPHAGALRYAEALAAASDRVRLTVYGTTAEGHELLQLVVARPDRLERLDEILAANRELTRPGTSEAAARRIAASNPAVVYFTYGVHGNESSSTEAALWTAWDLARGAPEAEGVLDSLVVVIDPVANPDGRERYVRWFASVVADPPNPHPQAREHSEPWPGGRYNHHLFDLNRDWAWATQPETRARLATWDRWNPQVHVDFHEMWYQSTYFFFPATAPINPIYPDHVLDWGRRFGAANARAFDARGWRYYTAEDFDLFYPGYGDSWPSLTGAVGMTYEQAGHGAAGLAIAREEQGDTLTLRARAEHHRAAGLATLRAAADGRTRLLMDYAAGQRSVGRGEADFLLVPAESGRLDEVAALLRRQGIEVERASSAFTARALAHPGFSARTRFPEGTLRVRSRQARGRLATTLLQPETELRGEYSYDVSAWALPYAFGVPAYRASSVPDAGWTSVPAPAAGEAAPSAAEPAEPGYGYLVAPGDAPGGLVRFLRDGGRARVLRRSSTLGGRRWPAGSWFIPTAGNDSVRARVARAGLGDAVVPVASGLSEDGIDLGSENVPVVRLPRVAVLTGEGISPTSFGAAWHFLEREAGLPFDAVKTDDVRRVDLGDYDVIVLPETGGSVDESVSDPLAAWVRAGGRLVALGGGARAVAGIAEVEMRQGQGSEQAEEGDDADQRARLLEGREARQRREWREEVPGVILPVRLDPAHPLAWGAGVDGDADRAFVLHQGARVFEPAEGFEAVAFFPEGVERISGVISAENLSLVGQGVWLGTKRVGRGSVVLFADDPLFRMFWRSTQPMFLNAVLLGPGI